MWRAGRWFILIIHTASQFSAYVCCGHTAAWIKMPLGTEVGLGLRDIVLDENPASPPLKGHSPQFLAHVYCGQTAGRMKTPLGTELDCYGTRPRPRPHCVRRGPSSPRKGHSSPPPSFRPMSIVATVAHTVELLLYKTRTASSRHMRHECNFNF